MFVPPKQSCFAKLRKCLFFDFAVKKHNENQEDFFAKLFRRHVRKLYFLWIQKLFSHVKVLVYNVLAA